MPGSLIAAGMLNSRAGSHSRPMTTMAVAALRHSPRPSQGMTYRIGTILSDAATPTQIGPERR